MDKNKSLLDGVYIFWEDEVTYIYVVQASMSNIYLQKVFSRSFYITIQRKFSSFSDVERNIVLIMWNFTTCEGAKFIFESLLVVFVCLLFHSTVFRFSQLYIYIHTTYIQTLDWYIIWCS